MIKTATQLKALVRNLAKTTGIPNYILIRRYMMDRFLERLSQTRYRDAFILKGGLLISEMVGLETRATKDIDTTVTGVPLTENGMEQVFREIIAVDLDDEVTFSLAGINTIMDESEYEGLRVGIDAHLDSIVMPLKIDISTGDAITPQAIAYDYRLMFEGRTIAVKAYPIETVLAEKIETMISRAETNTRMRDFYDMHILLKSYSGNIDRDTLQKALEATARRRGTAGVFVESEEVLTALENSPYLKELWQNYQMRNPYVKGITWDAVMQSARILCLMSGIEINKPSVLNAHNVLEGKCKHDETNRDRKVSRSRSGEER